MSQETRVFEVVPREQAGFQSTLATSLPKDAEWRSVPHATFSVKWNGIVLTVYRSGKAVLQGKDLDAAMARYLPGITGASAAVTAGSGRPRLEEIAAPTLGSDESGKGDYFGPLVVAAVFTEPADAGFLRELGATDSKLLSDARMQTQAGKIEERLDHEVIALGPVDYNRAIATEGNANHVLAGLHARALSALAARHPEARRTVVDRFSSSTVLEDAMSAIGFSPPALDLRPGAESHPAVAAASILARVHFLEGLKLCADECATDLPKGAGELVDEAARRVVRIGGRPLLAKVAKVHFKNTQKLERFDS